MQLAHHSGIVIRWLGQACFLITLLHGTRILIDPPQPEVGYPITAHSIPADIVFVSHEHFDHNFVAAAKPASSAPLRIVQPIPLTTSQIEHTDTFGAAGTEGLGDEFRYSRISAYHDNEGGAQRGPDTITVIDTNGLRIAHMGDIGELSLTPLQLKEIGRVDVLFMPVGGFFTVDAAQAATLIREIHPRVIIPMHYQTPALNAALRSKLHPISEFEQAMAGNANIVHVSTRDLHLLPGHLPAKTTVYILKYK